MKGMDGNEVVMEQNSRGLEDNGGEYDVVGDVKVHLFLEWVINGFWELRGLEKKC